MEVEHRAAVSWLWDTGDKGATKLRKGNKRQQEPHMTPNLCYVKIPLSEDDCLKQYTKIYLKDLKLDYFLFLDAC